ncbi:MAG: relaxase/mobilization nuclease domain-containing protein [Oscillospiraceae bacterium]|nr:relaxase/mobilization nuclease domain-containing protein [Oscillospiraceae bacterium]
MAATWIKPIRAKKGKTTVQTFADSLHYITNPSKTRNGELISTHGCDPRTHYLDFLLNKQDYDKSIGTAANKKDVLLYHIRISFKPGEITPEDAAKLCHDMTLRWTKGNHQFVVATHEDKGHIHCHIMYNAVNLNTDKKFKNFWGSTRALRRMCDIVCLENGLSVIENPKPSRGSYADWLGSKKEPSARELLEQFIEKALQHNPATFEEFIKLLEDENCEFKRSRRSVRLPGKRCFLRLKGLSEDYTEDAIKERIAGLRSAPMRETPTADAPPPVKTAPAPQERKFSLLIDVQNSIKAQNSPGYERWSKVFNLKQAAKTLMFLQDNDLDDLEKLSEAAQKAKGDFNDLQTRIHAADERLKEIPPMQKHIGTYVKTKDVYAEYKRRKFSKKFYAENEKAIEDCKAAKAFFDENGLAKLPTINSLKQEYATLTAEKKKLYAGYSAARNHMQEILMAQQNVHQLLDYRDAEIGRANDRTER